MSNFIRFVPAEQIGIVCAQLQKENVCFTARPESDDAKTYVIEITGY